MKVHNYGSDYAFQLRQKQVSQNNISATAATKDNPETEEVYVEHQVPTGGERDMATDPEKDSFINAPSKTSKASKKKKGKKD